MSRIGKKSINIPSGVNIKIEDHTIQVKGPKGELVQKIHSGINIKQEEHTLVVIRENDQKLSRELHGLTRTLINNMLQGVTTGFKKTLEINGVGYRANVDGKNLVLQLGYSHNIQFPIPEGLKINVDKQTLINIEGVDKQLVGQVAADIRTFRGPEPYKGKGIKYSAEVIRRKAGKAGAK